MIEQFVATVLQQGVDFGFIAQCKPESHRQHADSTMDRIEDGGMKHWRDGLVWRVDESTGQLSRKAPSHID
jgi:hypothetical protein